MLVVMNMTSNKKRKKKRLHPREPVIMLSVDMYRYILLDDLMSYSNTTNIQLFAQLRIYIQKET